MQLRKLTLACGVAAASALACTLPASAAVRVGIGFGVPAPAPVYRPAPGWCYWHPAACWHRPYVAPAFVPVVGAYYPGRGWWQGHAWYRDRFWRGGHWHYR